MVRQRRYLPQAKLFCLSLAYSLLRARRSATGPSDIESHRAYHLRLVIGARVSSEGRSCTASSAVREVGVFLVVEHVGFTTPDRH